MSGERILQPRGGVVPAAGGTASDPRPAGRDGGGPKASRVEAVATVILALAAVATWSGYQASRWHGEQAIAFSHANAARVESTRASDLANAQTETDVATFSQWVDAYARHETRLADFYRRRLRNEFQPAVAAWAATHPLRNANAPLTPFAMPNYRLAAAAQADRLEVAAEAAAAEASRDIRRANDYVLAVVLFSAALFFGGISTRLQRPGPRVVLLGVGCAVLVGTLVWVVAFPISISI
ncbi:MAG: hypothetical protein ACJ745_10540 [Actinomycetes bacterium]